MEKIAARVGRRERESARVRKPDIRVRLGRPEARAPRLHMQSPSRAAAALPAGMAAMLRRRGRPYKCGDGTSRWEGG